jgi:hypothetical protein
MKKDHNKSLLKLVCKKKLGLKRGGGGEKADSSASLRSDVCADIDCGDVLPVEIVSLCD